MISVALTPAALSIVLGVSFGLGVCLMMSVVPRWGAPSLSHRIAPYIRDITDPDGTTPMLAPVVPSVMAVWTRVRDALAAAWGSSDSLTRRLRQADSSLDAAAFRARQLTWAVVGVGVGGALAVVLVLIGRATPGLVLLPPVFAAVAAVICDLRLSAVARSRVRRIEEELPTVLEFLALCLSAGEGILDSLRRVSEVGAGEFTAEVRRVVLAVDTGSPLPESLRALARRLDITAVTRSIDQLVAAIDRGAPLAQVLHAQALDAREDAKRGLIERAGRNEILMLIPLVFLILPLSVLIAVFPGIFMLRLGIG